MELVKRLLRNFLILFFGNVVGQVLFLLGVIRLARVVGPAAFGIWAYSQAWFFYLLRAGEFGLELTGIRAIAKDQEQLKQRVSSVVTLRLLMATMLFAMIAVLSVLGVVPRDSSSLIILFSLGVFPAAISLEWVYEAVQRTRNVGLARIVKGLLFFLLVLLAVRTPDDLERSALYYVVSLVIPAVSLFLVARGEFGIGRLGVNLREAIRLLREALPIALGTLLSQYSLFFSTIFLGYVATPSDLGFFTAAHRLIIFVWAYGIVASNRVILPTLSNYFAEATQKYVEFLRNVTRVLAIVALPIGVIGSIVGRDLVNLLFGSQFSFSAVVFQILVWALVVAVMRSGLEIALIASHRQNLYLRGMAFVAGLHTVLDPLGFIVGGIAGVSLGILTAELCYALYLVFVSRSLRLAQLAAILWRISAAAVVTFGVLFLFPTPLVVSILLGLAVYCGTLILLGELSAADRVILRQLVGL